MPQLSRGAELTCGQVCSELAILRDLIAQKGSPPLICTRVDGYRFTADGDALQSYEPPVIHEKLTEIRRLITGTVTPHVALAPQDKWVHIVAQLNLRPSVHLSATIQGYRWSL
ncbi:RacP protein [Streptomyces sp. NBC_00459]|uniref:RacP protein n=1 Tax=Streptomyces sp. NBC_00459 TaxID=2975749 RepID=UPI002E196010